jgi:tetratricopeptide (TPR) repeat protein
MTMATMREDSGVQVESGAEGKSSRRWRKLVTSMSTRMLSNDTRVPSTASDEEGSGRSIRRRRPRRAHTMDNTLGDLSQCDETINRENTKRSNSSPLPLSPMKSGGSSKHSLLQRFLSSTARKRNLSGEGSTVSRMTDDEPDTLDSSSPAPRTRRATMELGELPSRSSRKSKSPVPPPAMSPKGGLRGVLRRFSGDGPPSGSSKRRGSRDSVDLEFEDTQMEGKEYEMMQVTLQRRADDLHKSGQIEEAISQWVECLALAEDNGDTLTNKTEILCILVDLHLQACQRQHQYNDDADTSKPEDIEKGITRHRQSASRYLQRIKPAMVKPIWWSNSKPLFELLVEAQAWELSLIVASRLAEDAQEETPAPEQLATIHFQIASQKLDTNRQGEALQHLQATVKYLQIVDADKRDMVMYTQVIELLATEYVSQGQEALALEAYQELLKSAPIEKHASLYCKMAHIHLVSQQLDKALEKLEAAASSLDSAESSIRLQLLQTKGDVYCRLGRMAESLQVYQYALEEVVNPAEKAKLLYTLGRLCIRLKHVRLAISYFTREMETTESELGRQHLSVSRILHELAKLYDEGLGEHKMALMKLHKALQIELAVLQECHFAITKCSNCNQVTHRMCVSHASLQRDVSNQIRETKKAQGRIHFKLGDFEKALKTSFDGTAQGRSSRTRRASAF